MGTQCPYGTIQDPKPVKVMLWDCPIRLEELELRKGPPALMFQADCRKKTLAVRSADRRIDTFWEVMPDGTFSVTIEGGTVEIASDGVNASGCVAPLSTDLFGRLECTDRDRVTIHLNAMWWLAKAGSGSASPACQLPASCYLHTEVAIQQCQ